MGSGQRTRPNGARRTGRRATVCALSLAMAAGALGTAFTGAPAAQAAPPAPAVAVSAHGPAHTVSYDKYSLKIDGKRLYVWSGEFHYWRLPSPSLWRDVLQKMKAAGFNAVSIYFDWGFHSPKPGVYDFTGVRDVDELLDIAQQTGIYVIARPGPYINAETDSGGFPAWLDTQQGKARSSAPDYVAAAKEWLSHIDPILARHQVTNGTGPVILYQVENEYTVGDRDAVYMRELEDKVRADGITVPLFHNDAWPAQNWVPGTPGAPDLYGFDGYPQGFDCSNPAQWKGAPDFRYVRQQDSPDTPLFIPEFQGGAFDPWGGPGYDKCHQLTGADFNNVFYKNNIASGVTLQSFYMTYGGTSWGWLPDPNQVYTSYDYGAAITEGRQLTDKYTEDKRIGYFTASVAPLTKTDPVPDVPASNAKVQIRSMVNPDTHTRFLDVRHTDSTSTSDDSTTFALDGPDGSYPRVPQQGAVELAGRDSKLLVAGYDMDSQRLVYSTSEIMTHARVGDRDVALLYGRQGQSGETVLRYGRQPTVRVLSGSASAHWDAARHDLRLDYTHGGLARVLVQDGGTRPLLLLLGSDEAAGGFWRQETAAGPVLESGPELVRTAAAHGSTLALTGDTDKTGDLEVLAAPSIRRVTWNGRPVAVRRTASGTLLGRLAGPAPVTLPALTNWRTQYGTPEAAPGFDDSSWTAADHTTTANPTKPAPGRPVLYADDYGFHHGDIWYRGHFTATGAETSVSVSAITGRAGTFAVWLNGTYLGDSGDLGAGPQTKSFTVPAGTLRAGSDNVLSVLAENMGHNEDWNNNDSHKEPRGLTGVTLAEPSGGAPRIAWRIQGNLGGENLADPTRGPMNNGGLYGERAGWYLPGFPDGRWAATTLPARQSTPGVTWYRTTFSLRLPHGQDTSLALHIADDPARHYRAQIFVNGWLVGRYINDLGPQTTFPVPNGILRADGRNTIAIASWGADGTGGLGSVSLTDLGTQAGGVPVADVPSPGWTPRPGAGAVRHS